MKTIMVILTILMALTVSNITYGQTPDVVIKSITLQEVTNPDKISEARKVRWFMADVNETGIAAVMIDSNEDNIYQVWQPDSDGHIYPAGNITMGILLKYLNGTRWLTGNTTMDR